METTGQPILSWEALLQAAAKVAGAAPSEPKAPSIKVLSLHSGPSGGKHETAYALVDSGATHPLRRASGIGEWQAASPVVVHLAGGEVVELRMNSAGTLLVPSSGMTRTTSTAPIVPLGSLVGVLGYRMEWHGSRCRLTSREGDVLNLRVRDGCPEVTEQQALDLIAKIEDKKLQTLRTSTEATRGAVRESMLVLNRSWFDHLISYCRSGIGSEALSAIQSAPFFQEVPQEALRGLSEADPISNGWDALRGLQHLNRRTRKKLWASKNWVVHLFAGKKQNEEVMFLERQGFAVLELDIERGKSHDICNPLVWRAIEWAARNGRISTVIGGPPQSTFMLRRSMRPGPEALRSNEFPYGGWNGQPDKDRRVVDRHTGLFAKMVYLHALATAGRCAYPSEPGDFKEVGFMLEQPRDPRGYLLFSDPLAVDAVSFWRTSLWILYAEEAGLSTFSFDMSSLGKALSRQTTVGTNLPLRQIDGLKGRVQDDPYPPVRAPPSVWTREFSEIVSIAVREQRITPRMLKMSAEQWKEHVRKGHLPFRSDCMTCVTAGATGRRHSRVEHPSCFVLSADVSGPLKIPGLDADARGAFPKPHKYMFVAKLKVPRTFIDDGRGIAVDVDPGELEADLPPEEGSFDFEELKPEEVEDESKKVLGDIGGADEVPEGDAEEIDDEDDPQPPAPDPGEALDVTGPDTVNLVFATAMIDNKGATVLEAIQDVVMYCWSLNIPIVRFHCDRGMEFYAKATRQWVKYHGMRFTTSEGGLHQQNGMVENAVRYIKQRARTLLIGAKLPQRLWPQAITMAASMQRASVLGMETRLAAPFGAKVLVRRREYGGTAEPGKPDDLAPRWLEGRYLGLSETVRRGHLVYLSGDDGEKFIHTVNVRVGLEDQPPPGPEVEADLPGPPSRRLRGKASGSGDVVSVSKAETVVGSEELKLRAQKLLEEWSQEEAEKLLIHVALSLNPNDRVFGVFRHGGRVGLTKATYDHPWIAEIFVKAMVGRCPEAEFSAVYVSVNTTREIHIDSNNLTGMSNYVYPLAMPSKGGGLWIELADGDVVRGKIVEMQDKKGHGHFGCVQPLLPGHVVSFNPHRRHAVLPWKGLRVVFVGYTPGVPQNLLGPEREVLSRLGFPVPSEVEQSSPFVALRVLSVGESEDKSLLQEEIEPQELEQGSAIAISDGSVLFHEVPRGEEYGAPAEDALVGRTEELDCWDMYLPLAEGDPQKVPKAMIASSVGVPVVAKTEVAYTKGIEVLLSNLQSPLTIVHTVDPAEAAASFKEWVKPAEKEISSFDKAAKKVLSSDPQIIADLRSGKAKIVPMKVVYTVKPPSEEAALEGQLYRRKVRIVACGNMMAESGEDTYAAAAPAEVVRSSLSVASMYNWDAAVLDVTAAFLQTPLSEVRCQQRILGQPPRALVRAGLCGEKELWEFTHAVYGLRESPRWWGEFRDSQMAQLNIVVGSKRIQLLQCRVEGSWWRLVDDRALVGLVVIYVDDLLICSTPTIIKAVSDAVKSLWETSSLSWASEGGIRFLGIEISKVEGGFALNQEPYIKELTRIHSIAVTQRDLVPVSKEMSSFTAESDEAVFTTSELREAQQVAGEVLWVSQRTRPDIAYVASLISSLSARWLLTLGSAPINWRSARQSTITLSTAESELGASVEGALALISAEALLSELDLDMAQSRLRTDSTSSLAIQRGSGSWRTRHLRIKAGWICERLEAGDLELEHWPGERQLADILTKPLSSMRIRQLSQLMGLMSLEEIAEYVNLEQVEEIAEDPRYNHSEDGGFANIVFVIVDGILSPSARQESNLLRWDLPSSTSHEQFLGPSPAERGDMEPKSAVERYMANARDVSEPDFVEAAEQGFKGWYNTNDAIHIQPCVRMLGSVAGSTDAPDGAMPMVRPASGIDAPPPPPVPPPPPEGGDQSCHFPMPMTLPAFLSEVQPPRSMSKTSKQLNTQLEPELLRAVPLDVALAGWGKHWETPDSGMFNVDPKNYTLSRPCESLDVFLSHDWASGGKQKLLSLLIVYNSRAAFLTCLVVSVLIGVLRGCKVLPDEGWTVVLGHGTYLFVFAFWQRLRTFAYRPLMVFLDKLCVAQHDEELKQKGIMGIAAFLLSSRQLMVLLTPRYLRRRSIQFMPLKTAVLLLLASACWFVLAIGWNVFSGAVRPGILRSAETGEAWNHALFLTAMMLLLTSFVLPFVFYLGMVLVADLQEIPRQLAVFRLEDAECFCCSNNHRHPHNGSRLPCDRQLVYNTLKQWYDEVESEADHLETFSRMVRDELAPSIALLVGGLTLPFHYAVFTVGASNLPYLADHVALLFGTVRAGVSSYSLFVGTLRQAVDWGTVPLASMLAVWISPPLWKAGLRLRNRWCAAIVTQAVVFFVVAMVWAPVQVVLGLTQQDDLLPVAVFLFWLALLLTLHSPAWGKKWLAWALGDKLREPMQQAPTAAKEGFALDATMQDKTVNAEVDMCQEAVMPEKLATAVECFPSEGTVSICSSAVFIPKRGQTRRAPPLQQPPPQKVFEKPRLEISIPESESDLHTYPAEAVQVRNTFIHVAAEAGAESDRLALSCPSSQVGKIHDLFTEEFQETAVKPVLNLEEALFEPRVTVPEPPRAPLAPIGPSEPQDFAETTIRPTSVPSSYAYSGRYSPAHGGAGRRCTERYSDSFSDLYPDTYPERYVGRYQDRYTEPYPDRGAGPYAEQYPMPLPERYSKRYADPYQEQHIQVSYNRYDRPYDRQYEKFPERYVVQYPERPVEYPEPCGERYNAHQSSSLFTDPRNSRPEMPPLPQQMPPPPPSVQTPPPPLPPPPPAPKKSRSREAPVVSLGSMPEHLLGTAEYPSAGSRDHRVGGCKPCAFLVKGCQNGIMCKFCHLCDAGEKKRRQKAKKAAFKAVQRPETISLYTK
ncbi:RE2 [Symbiodinium sp. CCMP2456]|nr:RE2 [Symbiodinium sp. CCMP2456]